MREALRVRLRELKEHRHSRSVKQGLNQARVEKGIMEGGREARASFQPGFSTKSLSN